MSDTISDVLVPTTSYVDLNTLSGIAAGTALVITNKSSSDVRLQISASQPSADSTDGEILYPGPYSTSTKILTAGENIVWAKSEGHTNTPLSIQDNS